MAALALAALAPPARARGAEQVLALDPAATRIEFTLGATLHAVEGHVGLVSGEIRFDPETGAASGELRVDARSASTDLALRDRNMHADVLESERHPEIVFRAEKLDVLHRDAAGATVELVGSLDLHGQSRPFRVPARVVLQEGGRVSLESRFRVAYVDWGMRDYSTFILRVDRFVDVRVSSEGRLGPP